MKKVAIILALCLCICLTGCSKAMEKIEKIGEQVEEKVEQAVDNTLEDIVDDGTYQAGDNQVDATVQEIDITWTRGNVQILYGDVDKITFTEEGDGALSEDDRLHWKLDGDTLEINIAKPGKVFSVTLKKSLVVTLPRDYALRELDAELSSASMTVQSLTLQELNVDGASGDLFLENVSADKLSADMASGKVSGTLLKATELEVDTASGEVNLSLATPFREWELDTASGDITLALPQEGGFTMELTTSSGDLVSDLPLTTNGAVSTYGDGTGKLEIETASGDITLNASN